MGEMNEGEEAEQKRYQEFRNQKLSGAFGVDWKRRHSWLKKWEENVVVVEEATEIPIYDETENV